MAYTIKHNEDMVAGLLRKQITDLKVVLCDFESGNPHNNRNEERLKQVEQQIRWLRKLWSDN